MKMVVKQAIASSWPGLAGTCLFILSLVVSAGGDTELTPC